MTDVAKRDPYIDTLRSLAIVRVVLYHLTYAGWLTIVYPSMGIMFAVGGLLTAQTLRRHRWKMPARRLGRVLPAYWVLAATVVLAGILIDPSSAGLLLSAPLLTLAWVFPYIDPQGSAQLETAWRPLWYLRAYLWFVLLTPLVHLLLRRHAHVGAAALLMLLVFAGNQHVGWLYGSSMLGPVAVDLLTYGSCWLVGMAFAHDRFRSGRSLYFALACAALVVVGFLDFLRIPELDLHATPVANALWSTAFALALLRFRPGERLVQLSSVAMKVTRMISRRSLTIYLWHGLAIVIATALVDRGPLASLVTASWTPQRPTWLIATSLCLVVIAVVAFGRIEDNTRLPARSRK
jgi:peptidoglycan/LPS O-acetylase OafA/YrhL